MPNPTWMGLDPPRPPQTTTARCSDGDRPRDQAPAAGITLVLDGGNLVATPKAAITDELRSLIRAHKADILAALAQEQAAAQDLREAFEERAAVLQHDAGLPRADAELEAARITATYARNRGYLWATLRAALAGYPSLLAQVPDRPGPVDSLPFGTATVHVREGAKPGTVSGSIFITEAEIEAARKGRLVAKQGDFTGAPEVKP